MTAEDFTHAIPKRGCRIILCEPDQRRIEAQIQGGEIIAINAYAFSQAFRWPMVGETWIIREENGSWFLDSQWEEQEPAEGLKPEPGDHILSAGSGRVLLNVKGKLKPLTETQLNVSGYVEDVAARAFVLNAPLESTVYTLPKKPQSRFILVIFNMTEVENYSEISIDGNVIAITERSGSVGANYKTTLTVVVPPEAVCHILGGKHQLSGIVSIEKLWESIQ